MKSSPVINMKLVILSVSLLTAVCLAERQKIRDMANELLVPLTDIPNDACNGDSYFGLAYINGSLEKCSRYNEVGKGNETEDLEYEKFKCKTLRYPMHAQVVDGKCKCNYIYSGPTCATMLGCPQGEVKRNGSCDSICENGGTPSVGSKKLECICPIPYDGDRCERIACFRMSPSGKSRYINSKTTPGTCECRPNYHGENCEIIKFCEQNATLTNQVCNCPDGFGGEICETKCRQGLLTCSTCSTTFLLSILAVFTALLWR